jgi:hypothetical protein
MNYQSEIFTICNQILAESSSNTTGNHPLTIQYNDEIYNATAAFPSEIKCVYRIKAIASDDICKCNQCGKIHGKLGKEYCSRTCRDVYRKENAIKDYAQHNAIRMGEKRYSDKIEGYDYLVCQICGAKTGELLAHIRMHDITADEYKATYGLTTLKTQKAIDNVKGEKNPGFNHGGKFSPFSEKFVYADTTDREELKKRAAKTRIDNENDTTQLAYWLKQTDGDVNKATELLAKRQSTFSLAKCIEKHGEEQGLEVWKARQEKWLAKYNDKTPEEMAIINKKKSNQMSFNILWTNSADVDGRFYLLDLKNGYYKFGITSRSIRQRYPMDKNMYDVLIDFESSVNHCFKIEQILKRIYSGNIISKEEQVGAFGWTETFKNINLSEVKEMVNKLITDEKYATDVFKQQCNLKYEQNF